MALSTTVAIETSPGSGVYVDLTAYLLQGSATAKLNTLDFALLDPPPTAYQLSAGVRLTNPYWAGTVASAMSSDPVDIHNGHQFVTLTATNTTPLVVTQGPFDLTDEPTDSPTFFELEDGTGHVTAEDAVTIIDLSEIIMDNTTFLTLEDGSGHYLLEDGSDWAPGVLLTEGPLSHTYAGLSVRKTVNVSGPPTTLGRCHLYAPGLRPGVLFKLVSLNQGYASPGQSFEVTQVTTTYPQLATLPVFAIEFGDTPQTLADWTLAHGSTTAAGAPPVLPPAILPPSTVSFGLGNLVASTRAMGAGIESLISNVFTTPKTGTCQVVGSIRAQMLAWDNFIAAPRRSVRATLSGGIFTGAWQELPFGIDIVTLDLSSASGLALAAGTYTVTLDVNTQEFNQMKVLSGFVQVLVTA